MLLLSMAVEPPHITLFSPPNREMMYQSNAPRYDDRLPEKLSPMYAAGITESGLTSSINPVSRKRSRDSSSFNPHFSIPNAPIVNLNQNQQQFGSFTFLNEDISSQIYQQQLEIDRLIVHHTEKVRSEIEEMRRRNLRRLMAALHDGTVKRLKTKEDEIMKLCQLNWSLEEKVKSLTVENQIWRELAETNEATANSLRNNLQQVLLQIQLQQSQEQRLGLENANVLIDDAESYCGSNYEEGDRSVAEDGGGERKVNGRSESRWCRKCGKEESCVLLLPCRHLCVCSVCVNSVSICPICKSTKSAGVHVNIN